MHMIQVIQVGQIIKEKRGGGEKRRKHNEWKQETGQKSSFFRLIFKESFNNEDAV